MNCIHCNEEIYFMWDRKNGKRVCFSDPQHKELHLCLSETSDSRMARIEKKLDQILDILNKPEEELDWGQND